MAFIKNLKYTGLTIIEPELKQVTEEEINAELERFRQAQSEMVEITDATATLKNGDIANIDFTGYVNGEKFAGGEGKNYDLEIGSHSFIPGFEEAMVDMTIGEERDVAVTFPEIYEPSLAGKGAIFKVVLHKIKQKKEVELTDELIQKHTKMETIEQFKQAFMAYTMEQRVQEYMAKKHDAMLDTIIATGEIEVTKDMIDAQIETMLNQLARDLTQYQMTVEQYFEMNGTTKEAECERIRGHVRGNIQKVLAIEYIIDKEHIVASDEEVEEFLKGNKAENIDKEGVKTNLSYVKVLEFLDKNNNWAKETVYKN